jgi:hypothetical protein
VLACAEPPATALDASLAWLRACWDAGDDHLPLTLVHDLGHVIALGRDFRFASTRDLTSWPDDERQRRLAYEDKVVGRWALDATVFEAHVLVAGMHPTHRNAAIVHALRLALGRALRSTDALVSGNPAHLRSLTTAVFTEPDAQWVSWALEQIEALTPLFVHARLFAPEDLWEIAHLDVLPNESARLALREVNGIAGRMGAVPAAVALSVRQATREVPVEAEEPDHYPAGGFDAISTRGVFENLVRSEVVYVGEGRTSPNDPDLFDLRFAESELLFYTRDESPMLDARRDLTVVIDRPAEQRYKHAALEAQTLILVEAMALALQGDLLRVFGASGSRVRVVWRCATSEDTLAANEERALLTLPLASEIAHRRVELSVLDDWGAVPDAARVVFSPGAPEREIFCAAWVRVGDELWSALDRPWPLSEGVSVMRALADMLLVAVARRRVMRLRTKHPRRPPGVVDPRS